MQQASDIVVVDKLSFAYGDLEIFRELSLAIPRGKVVAILGGSGSGKSTLLKLVGGQLAPGAGSVRIEGKDVHELDSRALYRLRLEIGMMFQNSGLFTDLSVYENIAFPIRENFKVPEDIVRRMVLMKLHAVGLRGAHGMKPGDLSGGMARRVALARAIATDPKLMMYDEPFAGLDPISLNQIVELLRTLNQALARAIATDPKLMMYDEPFAGLDPISLNQIVELVRTLNQALGLTSIVVTYDVAEALKVADFVYMIGDGAVVASGTPDELRASGDPYVQQFLRAEPDGPVRFHFPGAPLEEDLRLAGSRAQ